MFCKKCGKQVSGDSTYCMHCGAFLDYGSVATTAEDEVTDSKSSKNESPKTVSESFSDVPVTTPKYDDSYEKNYLAVVVGAGLMILNTTLIFNGFFIENSVTAVTVNMIWRIVAAVWITYIAKEQNREGFGWGLLGFLLPNLALIVIGLQRKLFKPTGDFDEVNHRPQEEQKQQDYDKDREMGLAISIGLFALIIILSFVAFIFKG